MRSSTSLWSSLVVALWSAACGGSGGDSSSARPAPVQASSDRSDWFVERAAASGLNFRHTNGMSGQMYIAEIMGPGVALLDFDNDGDLAIDSLETISRSLAMARASCTSPT
jgi:hypothetical protein